MVVRDSMKLPFAALSLFLATLTTTVAPAYAGDAATIVFKSGVTITLNNGYKQLVEGMKGLRGKGAENYPVEIQIEGTSFFINLGEVTVLCRDTCSALNMVFPKPSTKSGSYTQ
jgi:hypothetical protein